MTGPARTNTTTTAAEVLAETLWDMRRHIGLVVADWPTCVETAERHPGSLIARRVAEHRELVVAVHERLAAAGLLGDPTTRTKAVVKAEALREWAAGHLAYYPEDVFVPPTRDDWDWLARLVSQHGGVLDAFSAEIMRRAACIAIKDADRIEREGGEE